MSPTQIDQLKLFMEDSRELLNSENLEVNELNSNLKN